ncbi:MAG: hypothetical protein WCI11_01530 [Candidatus Methylumidiphilus sp.]
MRIEDALEQLQRVQNDPQALRVATARIASEQIEPGLFTVLEAAAIPHWFDAATLAAVLEIDLGLAAHYYARLIAVPQVESFKARNAHNVHEATRLAVRTCLAEEDWPRFEALSRRAAACLAGPEAHQRIEALYHRLSVDEPVEAAAALLTLFQEWHRAGRFGPLQTLALALDELLAGEWLQGVARARALVCVGLIRSGRLPLKQAESMAREAITLFVAANESQGEVDARQLLGNTLQTEGDLAGALREYQAFKDIMLRLTLLDPDNTGSQRELSASHNDVGRVLQAQGKLAEALLEFRAFKDIMRRLTRLDPDNTDWQRELSVSHDTVGRVLQAQGKLAEALLEYQADINIMRRLTRLDPDNTDWQRDLSVSHNNVGRVLQAQGKPAEALQEFQAGKDIMLRLTRLDPDNTLWQRDLFISHDWIATLFEQQGRLAEALTEREAGLAIVERLAQLDETNADWQQDLADSREALDALKGRMGRTD